MGKRVEATGIRLGNVSEIPNEEAAWKRVDELGLKPYSHDRPRNPRITFGEVAAHFIRFELPDDQTNATIEKSQSTITKYKHYLDRWVLPKWQRERALAVHPFEVEDCLNKIEREHRLETSTLAFWARAMWPTHTSKTWNGCDSNTTRRKYSRTGMTSASFTT
jgi:hypothetical protein